MNFEHYKNFITIVESRTISAASKILHISQPALSNQIKALEDEYGTTLLIRNPRSVELTDAGEILYQRAKAICMLEDSAKKEIDACSLGLKGTLRIGITPNYQDVTFSKIFLEFYRMYPNIIFDIYENPSGQIIENLRDKIVEVGIIKTAPQDSYILDNVISIHENYMLFYKKDNPWLPSSNSKIHISELNGIPLSITRGISDKITDACKISGFSPNYINVSASRSMAKIWADNGMAAAIIVGPSRLEQAGFCCRQIYYPDLYIQRAVSVLKNQKLSPVAKTFVDFCKEKFSNQTNVTIKS